MTVLDEIQELNLAYLMLLQKMVREDEPAALYRLGLSADVASQLAGLSPSQLIRMSQTNMLLCQFRYDEKLIVDLLSSHKREAGPAKLHAAILGASRELAES